jgi:hypothetical protein
MDKPPELSRLIHENFWTVLAFAFGRPAVLRFIDQKFKGEWKYLHKSISEGEKRVDRALREMATQLRALDDAEGLNDYYKQEGAPPLGHVVQADGTQTELHFRDMTNKLMHGSAYEWIGGDEPKIIVRSNQPERWRTGEISVWALMARIGGLGF